MPQRAAPGHSPDQSGHTPDQDVRRDMCHAFLYADPAAHSVSPQMHRAAFAWAGLAGEYDAVRVPAAELPEMVGRLRTRAVLGANLSLPHKEAVLPLLDELSASARAIGAVNTIVVQAQGQRLLGDNTDAPGLLASLEDSGVQAGPVGDVVVLGAGGAARAAVYALGHTWGRKVYVLNRTLARAQQLADELAVVSGPQARVVAAGAEEIPWSEIGLIVNSSSAGLNDPEQMPLPGFDFGQLGQPLVYDMVYKPAETCLMRQARAAGLRAENGLGMLAHQARLAFRAWTGVDVPVEVFLGAIPR